MRALADIVEEHPFFLIAASLLLLAAFVPHFHVWFYNAKRREGAPELIRYWIPYIGNGIEFGTDMMGLMRRLEPKAPVVTALINGKYMNLVTRSECLPYIYRAKHLSFRPTLAEFLGLGFGCSDGALEKLFLGPENSFVAFKENLQNYLLKSQELDLLTIKAQEVLVESIRATSDGMDWKTLNLLEWINDLLFRASASAFISPELATSNHLTNISIFDNLCPAVFLGIPMSWIPSGRKARESLYQVVTNVPKDDMSHVLQSHTKRMESIGMDAEDIQRTVLFLTWASVAQSMPAVFWTLYYLLQNPSAMQAVQKEIRQIQHEANKPWKATEIESMVVLQSVFIETLRMASSLRVMRDVMEDFQLDLKQSNQQTYFIRKGSLVVGFTPLLHFDPEVFENPQQFQWDRFLPDKTFRKNGRLVADPMRAFGGGAHLCPGRKFIANEVKIFVATLLSECEVQFVDGRDPKVGADPWRQGAGIPQPDQPVYTKLRKKQKAL